MELQDTITQSVAEAVKQVTHTEKDFKPHMMYDPKTGKGHEAKTHEDHLKMKDMGYTHEKPTSQEESNEFTAAAAKAKLAGKDEFDFEGKSYPVEIDQDAAEKILGKKESVEIEEGFLDKVKDKLNPKKAKAREALVKLSSDKKKLERRLSTVKLERRRNYTSIKNIKDRLADEDDKGKKAMFRQEIEDTQTENDMYDREDIPNLEEKIKQISEKMSEISKKFGVKTPKNEELSAKQKKIDLNKNGKVDGEDLANLRKNAKNEETDLQEAADFGDIEKVMSWAKKNIVGKGKFPQLDISKKYGTAFINLTIMNIIVLRLGGKKGIVVTHDDRTNGNGRGKEEHFSSANDVIKYVEKIAPKNESVEEATELEEASKDWEVVVTMGVNKLKKGQKVVVKARTSSEAIKKAAKAFNINDKLITGKVDANLKESTEVELQEGRFDKLEKKLGRINPESLEGVMSGKIKLNPAEKKEFDEFMKGVRKMFASTKY